MRRTRLLFTIALSLWSAVIAGGQTPGADLPDALRLHVKDDRFGIVTSVRGLPLGVRNSMQTLWNSATLDIAEPGAEFQSADAPGAGSPLPTRRLIAAGCSTDHCLVYYERGGRGRNWFVALYRWTPAETRLEFGGTAPRDLKTIDDVRKAVLSGVIRPTSPSSW